MEQSPYPLQGPCYLPNIAEETKLIIVKQQIQVPNVQFCDGQMCNTSQEELDRSKTAKNKINRK